MKVHGWKIKSMDRVSKFMLMVNLTLENLIKARCKDQEHINIKKELYTKESLLTEKSMDIVNTSIIIIDIMY